MQEQIWLFSVRNAFQKNLTCTAKSQHAIRLYSCESIFITFAPCYVNFPATSLDSGGKFNFGGENTEIVDKVHGVDASLWSMLLNVTWNLPWNVSKHLGFRKLLVAHTVSYFTITIANYNCCEMRMTHQENQHGRFHAFCMCFACGNCLHFAFLAKISCKHGAFHSVWEIEFLFILRMAVKTKLPKTFRIDCFKGEHSVFQGCFLVAETCMLKSRAYFWFCGLKRRAWH